MTPEDHARWERYYEESVRRDFERTIYARCDDEDRRAEIRDVIRSRSQGGDDGK